MAASHGRLSERRKKLGLSGLTGVRRLRARRFVWRACRYALDHKAGMNYSQGSRRWEGIDKKMVPWGSRPRRPEYADCSSSSSWALWAALSHHFGLPDTWNGTSNEWGWTGTLIKHGLKVRFRANWRLGDLIFYGDPFGSTGHVAVYLGAGLVFSFGSQGGPHLLRWNYRSDFHSCRRFI